MSQAQQPIGIFDSGIGGLTVANAIHRALPNEQLIYFGDLAHLPYGDKSADAIRYFSLRISKFLLEQDAKCIVIACNTASAAAYDMLTDFFGDKVRFVNVVDPLVKAVVHEGRKHVGVIATKGTIHSNVYKSKILSLNPDVKVTQLATPLLVPMIEEGYANDNVSDAIIQSYLQDPALTNIDSLLLACTHYPLIKAAIQAQLGDEVLVLDSTDVVVDAVQKYLSQNNLLSTSRVANDKFYVSDYTSSFETTAQRFYGHPVELEVKNIW